MNIPVTTTTTGASSSSSSSVANATATTTTSISNTTTNSNNNEDLEGINLSDPEEIHAHLQVLDVRQRLRQRRKRMIQLFSLLFVGIAIYFFIRLELFNSNNNNNNNNSNANNSDNDTTSSSSTTTTLLPQPPVDLASKCSLATLNKPNGIEICEEACEISDCCNIPTDYALSCNNKQNEIVCARYQRYCDILHNLPENLQQQQQQQSSSSSNNNSDNQQQQQQESSSNTNDIDGGDDDASSPTTPVVNNNPSLTIQEQISQACNNLIEGMNSPSTGEETCENVCSPSVCCFNHLCNPPPDINCNEYVQCHNLYDDLDTIDDDQLDSNEEGGGSEYPTLQEEIENSCQNINLIPIAKSECEAICAIGSCCFIQDLVCPTTDVDCQQYQGCNVLYDNNNNDATPPAAIPGTASPTSSPIVVATPTPAPAKPPSGPSGTSLTAEEVNDACNNHNDNALIRPTLCEQVCTLQVIQCCFHSSSNNNVAAQGGCDEIPCNVYEACEVLGNNPEYLREVHIQELNEACNNDATRNHCVRLCAPASCCYATTIDEECINVDTAITCSDYEACNVLYQNSNNNNMNNGNAAAGGGGGIGGGSDSGLGSR